MITAKWAKLVLKEHGYMFVKTYRREHQDQTNHLWERVYSFLDPTGQTCVLTIGELRRKALELQTRSVALVQ